MWFDHTWAIELKVHSISLVIKDNLRLLETALKLLQLQLHLFFLPLRCLKFLADFDIKCFQLLQLLFEPLVSCLQFVYFHISLVDAAKQLVKLAQEIRWHKDRLASWRIRILLRAARLLVRLQAGVEVHWGRWTRVRNVACH